MKLTSLTTIAATLTLTLAAAAASLSVAPTALASSANAVGNDISWPQCPKSLGGYNLPGPTANATFAIVGLNGGGSFYPNPCLAGQVAAARGRHLWTGAYAVMTYPSAGQVARFGGPGTAATRLTRVGRAEAAYNLAAMRRAHLSSPMVWLDIEYVGGAPWSANVVANNAVINGVLDGYRTGGVHAGIYSYLSAWKALTGGRSMPTVHTWVPVGHRSQAVAAATCALRSYSGSKPWVTQWGNSVRDYDLTCPGIVGKAATGNLLSPYLHTVLAIGSRGGAVAVLQRHLRGLVPDGVFGPLTRARVVAFQRSKHLRSNGIVTSVVWRALGAGTGKYSPARASLMPVLFART